MRFGDYDPYAPPPETPEQAQRRREDARLVGAGVLVGLMMGAAIWPFLMHVFGWC